MQNRHVKDKRGLEDREKEVICEDYDGLSDEGLVDSIKGSGL